VFVVRQELDLKYLLLDIYYCKCLVHCDITLLMLEGNFQLKQVAKSLTQVTSQSCV
jgi:hypothetical protein